MVNDRLIVQRIEVANFLSYAEPQAIELGGRGPVAIVGRNGAGKSTIVSKALTWALYGACAPERMGASTKALRGKEILRRRLSPVQAATGKADTAVVKVTMTRGEQEIRVERSRKRTGSETLEIFIDGERVGTDQVTIDGIIGANYDVFVRTCLRGQGDPWSFAEATDARKREILDAISGAETLIPSFEVAKSLRTKAQAEADTAARRAEDAERRADACDARALQADADAWEAGHAAQLAEAQAEVAALTAQAEAAEARDAEAAEINARIAALGERPTLDMQPYYDAVTVAQRALAECEADLRGAMAARDSAAALLAQGACPTCGQDLAGATRAHDAASVDLQPLEQAVERARAYVAECIAARDAAKAWLRDQEAAWDAERAALGDPRPADEGPRARRMVEMAVKRLDDLRRATNPFRAAVAQAQAQEYALRREASYLREMEAMKRRDAALAEAWMGVLGPKGVRAHLAEASLAAIEAEANRWLAVLSDGRFSVEFRPTRETRTGAVREQIETIVRSGDQELPLLNFSGGEKRRINLAVDLGVAATFSRGGALALSLLVLDEEVFSGLDDEGKAAVAAALHHAGVADVVVIDHDPRLAGVLPRTVRIAVGPDGYSRVIGEG